MSTKWIRIMATGRNLKKIETYQLDDTSLEFTIHSSSFFVFGSRDMNREIITSHWTDSDTFHQQIHLNKRDLRMKYHDSSLFFGEYCHVLRNINTTHQKRTSSHNTQSVTHPYLGWVKWKSVLEDSLVSFNKKRLTLLRSDIRSLTRLLTKVLRT